MEPETEPPQADWTAWILQLMVGILVGAVGGFFLVLRNRFWPGLKAELQPWFISGAALFVGALATRYGDRLWLGDSHRVIPRHEIAHSRMSRLASGMVMLGGMGLMGCALATHFGYLP